MERGRSTRPSASRTHRPPSRRGRGRPSESAGRDGKSRMTWQRAATARRWTGHETSGRARRRRAGYRTYCETFAPGGRSRSSARSASVSPAEPARTMPFDSTPISVAGSRFATTTTFRPPDPGPVVLGDARHDRTRLVAELHRELQQLLRLRHGLGVQHLGDAEIQPPELLDRGSAATAGAARGRRRRRARPPRRGGRAPDSRATGSPATTRPQARSASRGGPAGPSAGGSPPPPPGTNGSSTIPRTRKASASVKRTVREPLGLGRVLRQRPGLPRRPRSG